MAHRVAIAVILVLMFTATSGQAGGSVFSPNGAGEQLVGGGVRAAGLGGGAFGWADSMSFNSLNPSLAAYTRSTTYRLSGKLGFWSTSENGRTDSDAELVWQDLRYYFPITKRWVVGLGAEPSFRTNLQTFAYREAHFADSSLGISETVNYEERNRWQGSTIHLRFDQGARVTDRIALGLGLIYVLRHNERHSITDLPAGGTGSNYSDAITDETETFRGWSAVAGAQMQITSKLGFGATFQPRTRGEWRYSVSRYGRSLEVKHQRRGNLPGMLALGGALRFHSRWVGMADVQVGQWKEGDLGYRADSSGYVKPENPLFVSVGVERLAGRPPRDTGFDRWGYRGGWFYRRHYWPKRTGESVTDLGLAVGVSLPVGASRGWVHASLESGLRGQNENKLGATETFARFGLQLEMGETWFQRSRPRRPQ